MGDRQSQRTQPKIEKWVGKHRGEQVARLLLWAIRVISTERKRLPLFTQVRTCRCVAPNDARGHFQTLCTAAIASAPTVLGGVARGAGADIFRLCYGVVSAWPSALKDPDILATGTSSNREDARLLNPWFLSERSLEALLQTKAQQISGCHSEALWNAKPLRGSMQKAIARWRSGE